ncbi:M20 family metallopeptidase [Alkalihalobacillus sp. BA299]|uniref:M20 family metallopeptidase n=1 Tax=Alkalihalobacillus sp. BA299 TaxID=2815938 RepID=UPI001ADCFAAD|nr:M20 family metallopeptidase [Alkalihalobacillus sp. BA299]
MNEVVQFIKEKEEEMIEVLRELVEMESPSRDKDLTDQISQKVAGLFEQLTGGQSSIILNQPFGNHIRGEWGEGEKQILLLAHFDTVWPKGTIETMPFTIKDGKAFGPGVFDMKGGLVQGLFALHALNQLARPLLHKVVFLFTSDEEIGSPTSRELIEKEAGYSEYVFVLEPGMTTEGAIKTARKGVGMFQLEIKGKPAHAGVDPEKGRSAIEEMAKQVSYLHSLTDFEKGTTVNVGKMEGGTTSNVVAAKANAEIDLRVKTEKEFARIVPLINSIESFMDGVEVHISGGINRPPLERTEEVVQLYKRAQGLAKKYLDIDLQEKETGGGSDGNFTAPFAPTIDGLGAVGDGAHASHEHLIIAEMTRRSALVAMLLMDLSQNNVKEEKQNGSNARFCSTNVNQ